MPLSRPIRSTNSAGPKAGRTRSSSRGANTGILLDNLNTEGRNHGSAIVSSPGLPNPTNINSKERRHEDGEENGTAHHRHDSFRNGTAGGTSHQQLSRLLLELPHTPHKCPTCGTSTKEKRPWSRKCCGEYPGFGSLQSVLVALGIIVGVLIVIYVTLPANKNTKETNEVSKETQEWMAWYTWRWQVCPNELVSP